MAIRGGLSEFSVAEILQLLALQQKSGVLALTETRGGSQVLFFERGRVLAAADRRQDGRHAFLTYLSANMLLTRDQLESVEDICRGTGHDLFTVLVSSGVMGRDRLLEEMRAYTQRIVDEVVNWRDGTYEFSGDEKSLPSQGITLKLNPEELLLESMRRNDELATLKESMLAPDLILARVKDAETQPLPRECTVVLNLVSGRRTIDEICRLSPLGDYLTYDAVSELLSRQQVMIVDPQDVVDLAVPRASRHRVSVPAAAAVLSLILGSLLLGTGMGPLLRSTTTTPSWLPPRVAERRAAVRDQIRTDVMELRRSIEFPAARPSSFMGPLPPSPDEGEPLPGDEESPYPTGDDGLPR
jgi:hypothetical protein